MKDKEYPCDIISKKIGNSNVELVGVFHTKDFFEKHKLFYEKKIKESIDGIVLEQPSNANFWEVSFFSSLGEIAYKNNIQVYQADPIEEVVAKFDYTYPIPLLFGVSLLGGAFFKSSTGKSNKNKSMYSNKMSRRDFLVKTCLGMSGLSIVHGSFAPYSLITGEKVLDKLNLFAYGHTDWRNVRIAKGIKKICKKEKPKKLTAFHGELHTQPISHYLNYPNLRETKNIFYAPFNLFGRRGVRKYISNQDKENLKNYSQSWELKEVF